MELWTAFVLGFLGSLHCIGMCGPIALALPTQFPSRTSLLISRTLYNFGRVFTYCFLGVLAGLAGNAVAMAGFQQTLSIITGVLILLGVILPSKWMRNLFPGLFSGKLTGRIRQAWGRLFGKRAQSSLLAIGLLNGFLPCGLVYVGLAAAASTGSIPGAVAYMATFGLGTVPVMMATSLSGHLLGVKLRQRLMKLIPVGAIVLAVLLILRGMSLGIPYVSPKVDHEQETVESCCH